METDPEKAAALVIEWFNKIKAADAATRDAAWRGMANPAAEVGMISDVAGSDNKAAAKAARGLLEAIAHRAARPGSRSEAQAVTKELLAVAQSNRPTPVRALALHLTGFTADGAAVPALAKLLAVPEVQDEARMALERIPGSAATNALKTAQKSAPSDFRPALAQSLRNRALTPKTVGMTAGAHG